MRVISVSAFRAGESAALGHVEILEPAGADQHPRFQRADGAVVALTAVVIDRPSFVEVSADPADPLVELAAELVDLAGVGGERLWVQA